MAFLHSGKWWIGFLAILGAIVAVYGESETYRVVAVDGQEVHDTFVEDPLIRVRRDATGNGSTATSGPTSTPVSSTTTNPLKNVGIVKDNHRYYTKTIINDKTVGANYRRAFSEAFNIKYKRHSVLSNSHRIALQVKISFNFLFYGHKVNKVTIATGGFLYMSHYLHRYLTYTQYIAPLMADFDTGIGSGDVRYADTGDAFFVLWENIHLKKQASIGQYTFQAILHKNGTIMFAYHKVPAPVSSISTSGHVVKAGIADAYYHDSDHPTDKRYLTRKIIQYDSIDVKKGFITSDTVVIFHPTKTCVQQSTCSACVTSKTNFDCAWCDKVKRCSSGIDRLKQEWEMNKCHKVNTTSNCPYTPLEASVIVLIILIVIVLMGAIAGFGYWIYYAYSHPATPSGIWLMEHRPTVLMSRFADWRRGGNNNNSTSADIYRVDSTA